MAWTDNIFRWLGFGRYNSTLPTVAESAVEELQIDQRGRLRVSVEAAPAALAVAQAEPATRYVSAAVERAAQPKAAPGVVREVQVISSAAVVRYLLLFNKTTALAGGDVPFYRLEVPSGGQVGVAFTGGYTFSVGLRVALSSTALTYTDPGADEGLFYVEMDEAD